jgi:molybdopterin converting factor small subunit
MKVLIPSALHSYTGGGHVEANGATVADVLEHLDRRFPGIRFRMIDEQQRIRPHIRLFYEGEQLRDLDRPLREGGELIIVQALSGG